MPATPQPRLARAAAMVADPARSRMLSHLLAGQWSTAGELARAASVTPATASGHLSRLLQGQFVVCESRGRHRYYRLADADVAHALEALALVAERGETERAWARPERAPLRWARCCYGHLAGRLGVALLDTLQRHQGLRASVSGYALTEAGVAWLAGLGLQAPSPGARRRYAYPCLDWSERRDHLAGQLADAILQHCIDRDWLRRADGRALAITPRGREALLPRLALEGGPPDQSG